MAAERKLLVTFTNAVDGRDQELNDWYVEHHIPDVLAIPGFKSAERFQLDEQIWHPAQHPPLWRYMTVYEAEGTGRELFEATNAFREAGRFKPFSSAAADGRASWLFTPVPPK